MLWSSSIYFRRVFINPRSDSGSINRQWRSKEQGASGSIHLGAQALGCINTHFVI